jgi:hypothetical protein
MAVNVGADCLCRHIPTLGGSDPGPGKRALNRCSIALTCREHDWHERLAFRGLLVDEYRDDSGDLDSSPQVLSVPVHASSRKALKR